MVSAAAAAARSGRSGFAARKAPVRALSIQPAPVTRQSMSLPPCTRRTCSPSVTRSVSPVCKTTAPVCFARRRAFSPSPSGRSAVSTPRSPVSPVRRARISLRLPRMTVGSASRSSSPAVSRRKPEAPTPTGSSTMGLSAAEAAFPASSMASFLEVLRVPRFSTTASAMAAICAVSSGASAMMGDAPAASSRLAQSLAVT